MASHAITFCEGERRVFAHRALMPCSEWASKHLIVQDGLYKGSPLRLDVATPLQPRDGDPPIQIYVSIGQSF